MNWRNETARFCVPTCGAIGNACVDNLKCTYVTDLGIANASLGCWLDFNAMNTADAGSVPFTGGGYPVNVGNACTTDTQCQNPPDIRLGYCVTEAASGWPGGYCIANTSYADNSQWCVGAGKVVMWDSNPDGGDPESYYCAQGCSTPGDKTGLRSGYACFYRSVSDTATVGVVFPGCAVGNNDCGENASSGYTCDATTGWCCQADGGCANALRD